MRQYVKKSCVREGHRRTLVNAKTYRNFKVVYACRQICATDKIEPFLHLVLVYEASVLAFSLCGKEQIQIEAVKFSL